MPKTITLRLNDEVYARFRRIAESENRPLANLIETAALRHLDESFWADDEEVAEIQRNAPLVKKLAKASREARERKGRFVE